MAKKGFDSFDYPKKGRPRYYGINNVVLFFDIVGFTKDTTNDEMQSYIQHIENVINRLLFDDYNWNEKRDHNHLILIPTGDGYGIGFNPSIDGEKILSIASELFKHLTSKIISKVRMGIAKGSNIRFLDLNDVTNLFGFGINIAFRTMTAALENQILVHETFANELLQRRTIKELNNGPYVVSIKHDETISVYNYFKEGDFGNSAIPS